MTDRQFLASEAWSTSDDLLQDLEVSKVASGVLGVAIRSSTIPGFENYLRSLHPTRRPDDDFLRELWEKKFRCSYLAGSSEKGTLPLCSGTESLEGVNHPLTDTSQLRVAYNVYLAVYAAAHALHSLLSCPRESSTGNNSSSPCFHPNHIESKEVKTIFPWSSYSQGSFNIVNATKYSIANVNSLFNIHYFQLLQHLNRLNVTTPQGEMFYFQGGDTPAKYDLVNWQNTPEGSLKLVLIGRVDGFNIHLNESAIQWSTGSSQVV